MQTGIDTSRIVVGDVVQIVETHGRAGWVGAFVLVTELKGWGIMGYVHVVETHDKCGFAYIRLKWDDIEYVGKATLTPGDLEKEPTDG